MSIENKRHRNTKTIRDLKDLGQILDKEKDMKDANEEISVSVKIGDREIPITPDTPDGSIDVTQMLEDAASITESIVERVVRNSSDDAGIPDSKKKCEAEEHHVQEKQKAEPTPNDKDDLLVIGKAVFASFLNVLSQPFGYKTTMEMSKHFAKSQLKLL